MSLLVAGFAMHRYEMFWPDPLIQLDQFILGGVPGSVQLRVVELVVEVDT